MGMFYFIAGATTSTTITTTTTTATTTLTAFTILFSHFKILYFYSPITANENCVYLTPFSELYLVKKLLSPSHLYSLLYATFLFYSTIYCIQILVSISSFSKVLVAYV
jgi:hypothetical protein